MSATNSCRPDASDSKTKTTMCCIQNSSKKMKDEEQRTTNCTKLKSCNLMVPNSSTCFRNLLDKIRATLRKPNKKKACPKVTSSTSDKSADSQRAEAIDDCIEFINSSFSLPRSNSVSDH